MPSLLHVAVSLPPDISRGYQYVAEQWSLVSAAVIVVILRFCIRSMLRRKIRGTITRFWQFWHHTLGPEKGPLD